MGPWVIVASGPSLTQEQVNYCKGKARVLVINDNYKLAPWADILYACDVKWWEWHEGLKFDGEMWTQNDGWNEEKKKRFEGYGVQFIESSPKCGLSTDKTLIHQGLNSGIQAINLAYHFGANPIILIGYDMKPKGDKFHWFGDHPDKVRSNYSSWMMFYDVVAKQAREMGLEIINCTLDTALTCFPKMTLEEAFGNK